MTKEWTKYKGTILKLYKDQSKTLDEVRRIMKDEYGFEASVRAYRSRFDKWRAHKYNIARRRSATATMAAVYDPAARAGDISPLDSFQGPGMQTQMSWARHCSAPDLPVVDGDVSLYQQQQQQQHAMHSQTRPDAHSDDMSPVSSTFGHDPVEQQYCPLAVQEDQDLKALVHRFARQDDGIVSVAQEQAMLGGGQYSHHSHQNTSTWTELEWNLLTLQVPFQLGQLEELLHCLLFRRPDIHRPLPNGHSPFSHMADLFFDHVSSSASRRSSSGSSNHHHHHHHQYSGPHPAEEESGGGGGGGDDQLLSIAGQCLQQFLHQGADPNTLVGGANSPLLFRLLGAPTATGAFGPLWNCVRALAARALPVRQDRSSSGGGSGAGEPPTNALHVLLDNHDYHHEQGDHNNPGGLHLLAPDNGGRLAKTSSPMAMAMTMTMTAVEAHNRAQLTTVLIQRLVALGRLDDRGPRGLSAFELYVRGSAAGAVTSREGGRHFFFRVSAEFVRFGADAGAMVPRGFPGEVRAAFQQQQQQQQQEQQQQRNQRTTASGALLRLGSGSGSSSGPGPGIAPWTAVWISACQRRLAGDDAAVEEHLSVLQYCTKGQVGAEALRGLLPKPGPATLSPPAVVVLASPATSRSEFSEEGGSYTW